MDCQTHNGNVTSVIQYVYNARRCLETSDFGVIFSQNLFAGKFRLDINETRSTLG